MFTATSSRSIVSSPSVRVSHTAVTVKVCRVTPAAKVSVFVESVWSVFSLAPPPVTRIPDLAGDGFGSEVERVGERPVQVLGELKRCRQPLDEEVLRLGRNDAVGLDAILETGLEQPPHELPALHLRPGDLNADPAG